MRYAFFLIPILLLALPVQSAAPGDVVWTVADDGKGQIRGATFEVADFECAYSFIAEPQMMEDHIGFVEEAIVHSRVGGFQHVSFRERFFPVGVAESRYHRQVDGHHLVTWELQEGRQKKHDGVWTVETSPRGARVTFSNTIEAKSFLHQPILENIQRRAMAAIVAAAITTCGAPLR